MRIPCILLLLFISFASHATPTGKLSPEQAFDLFARALLESDAEAGETLHRAMHAAQHGDAPLAVKAARLVPEMVEALAKGEIDDDIPPEFAAPLGEVIRSTYLRSHCRATSAVPVNESAQGLQQVTLSFRCQVPDWDAAAPPLTDEVISRMRADASFAYGLITTTVPTLGEHTAVSSCCEYLARGRGVPSQAGHDVVILRAARGIGLQPAGCSLARDVAVRLRQAGG